MVKRKLAKSGPTSWPFFETLFRSCNFWFPTFGILMFLMKSHFFGWQFFKVWSKPVLSGFSSNFGLLKYVDPFYHNIDISRYYQLRTYMLCFVDIFGTFWTKGSLYEPDDKCKMHRYCIKDSSFEMAESKNSILKLINLTVTLHIFVFNVIRTK